ncbi:serine threonine protein phosphatase pp2a-associated protein [Salix suchowensis]|nr:serine threonine protein phosphatase pp2a-associated protein [Salix suchowensis]
MRLKYFSFCCCFDVSTNSFEQNIVQSCLSDLKLLQSRITGLGLFSPNETIEDISTRDLVYLLVPYIYAQVIERMRTTEREDRLASLAQAQVCLAKDRELYKQKASTIRDPSTRRELKIKQYKNEKQLKQKIEAIAIRRNQASPLKSSPSEFDLIMALLPPEVENDDEQDDEDEATSDAARDAILLLLRLAYTHANSQFESMDQELDLLRSAPPEPPTQTSDDPRRDKRKELDDMWRLDAPTVSGGPDGKGPLLDPSGKSCLRNRAYVFRAASLDAEEDGTLLGEANAEKKRQKDENWAVFTDENPKGAGNTMNRG